MPNKFVDYPSMKVLRVYSITVKIWKTRLGLQCQTPLLVLIQNEFGFQKDIRFKEFFF